MTQHFTYYADLQGVQLNEDNGKVSSWLKIMNHGTYKHALYGELKFDQERTKRFSDGQKAHVRGIELDVDYDHKQDPAKGHQAAGWIKDTAPQTDGLYALVEWTPDAVGEIRAGKWRYFSPDYADEWTDPRGVTHQDVLMGGGITNRPFLKDLLPINLSELVFAAPAPVVPSVVPPKEKEVDPKQLREQLGLTAEATDADVETRLALVKQLAEAFPQGVPVAPKPVERPTPPSIKLGEELKQLAEQNPAVKALVAHMEDQIRFNGEMTTQLREATVTRKLTEFNTGKIVLTKPAADLVMDIMLSEGVTPTLEGKIWSLMEHLRNNSGLFIELGERSGAMSVKYGRESVDAETQIKRLTEEHVKAGMKYADAALKVAKDNPSLYNQYRDEAYSFQA